jgi:hypothetical protein
MAAGLPQGTSIPDKIASAQTSLAAGDTSTAIATLKALVKELSAQSGKKLTTAQAISLSAATKAVIAVLGG